MRKLRDFYLTIDLRSLGLYRVLLAALLIVDLLARPPNSTAFYSGLVIYLLLLIGYRTRLFQFASFAFLVSTHKHIEEGLATMLMWSLFLAMGKHFSLDAIVAAMKRGVPVTRRGAVPPEVGRCEPSVAAFAIVAQLVLTYFFTAAARSESPWKAGALAALILVPRFQPWLRRLAIVGVVAMQVTGTVPFAMIAACALLLLPEDWELMRPPHRPVTIYYDDTCGFCHWCAQLLVIADRVGNLSFIGNHDTAAFRHELAQAELESSIVVFDEMSGERATRAAAFAVIFRALPLPFHIFCAIAWPRVRYISDAVYDFVARNRYRFSRWLGFSACGIDQVQEDMVHVDLPPSPRGWRRLARVLVNLIAAALFAALLIDGYDSVRKGEIRHRNRFSIGDVFSVQ
jgi:predicted DCC family thiol-disulfide oxidoreductase YuxK